MHKTIFRVDEIINYCINKSVLHLGFVQHDQYEENIIKNTWLHSKIDKVAKNLVGIDYLEKNVNILKEKYNYEAYSADVMDLIKLDLDKKFDVIICAELIEHIENPGLMLDGIKKFMNKNSILIITTPNPWAINHIKFINKNIPEDKWVNKEHVTWFSYGTLSKLLTRKGYEKIIYDYYYNESKEAYQYNTNGFRGLIRKIRRYTKLKRTKKTQYKGLFFISKKIAI